MKFLLFTLASGKLKLPERKWTIDLLCAQVMASIQNHQLYRHIERPGWRLSWSWAGEEVIWDARGAEATEQGDCSRVGGGSRPHCCQKRPVMADLPPGTPFNQQVANCCRDGVLSSLTQNNLTSAAFQMVVGDYAAARDGGGKDEPEMPWGFDIGVPGYSCSNATKVPPTRSKVDRNRHVQVLRKAPLRSYVLGRRDRAPLRLTCSDTLLLPCVQ